MREPSCLRWRLRALSALLLISASVAGGGPAQAKAARCVIRQNGTVAYSGPCEFIHDRGGSFGVRRRDGRPLLPEISDVSVMLTAPGQAEVRGLTLQGINSRWGPARRSTSDPACWTGSDFEVCAY